MSILVKGTDFGSTEQVTSTKLDNLVDAAKFTNTSETAVSYSGSTGTCLQGGGLEVTTAGQLHIKDGDINTVKLNDSSVTKAKIENVANLKVLGNTSGSAAAPQEVTINDTDAMSDASATTIATSESIKAYVDSKIANCLLTSTTSSIALNDGNVVPFNSEISDTSGLHDNSSNNSRITIGTAGVYILTTTITTNETDNGDVSIAFLKNGSTEISRVYFDSGETGSSIVLNLAHTALLSASDYVEVKIVQLPADSTVVDGTKSTFNASLVS
tara:strand:+ start:2552 stop:3364 length:813 start_codon:yes stop_codon:yes gene_type:complete